MDSSGACASSSATPEAEFWFTLDVEDDGKDDGEPGDAEEVAVVVVGLKVLLNAFSPSAVGSWQLRISVGARPRAFHVW